MIIILGHFIRARSRGRGSQRISALASPLERNDLQGAFHASPLARKGAPPVALRKPRLKVGPGSGLRSS
eukprot:436523-Pyramimonas_sp.AAC.1